MSDNDKKLTLDLGVDEESPTIDLSKTALADEKLEDNASKPSGNTIPDALNNPINTLDLSGVSQTENSTDSTNSNVEDSKVSSSEPSSGDADDFVPVILDELPDQPVEDGVAGGAEMSEADYWNASSDLFTGAHLSDGNTNLPPTTSLEESAFSERRKRILAVVLLAAVFGGAVFTEPDLFLSFLNTDSYEEMEDPDEADLIGEETPDEDMGEDGEITGDILGEEDEIEGDDPSLEDIADNEETVDPNMDNEVVDGEVAPAEEEQFAEAPPQELGENEIDWKDNPYWNLPNHFSESIDKPLETWTVEQEEAWRENLDSKFIWQKYKVLDEIKDARLAGSEVLLWDLTREKKLWLRLKALMALADFGEKVSIKDVLDAVENARPSTIANFVKRFRKDSSVGELFVLRQMVRIMDTRGRYEILRVLKDQSDKYSDLYLTAGSLDPDEKVSRWAERKISSIEEKDLERLTLVVQGKAAFEDETLLLDQQAAENAEKEKNLFGGMVDPVAEREKERIENEKKNGNLFAEDEGIEEEEFEEDEDMEEVMIYE